MQEEIFGPVLVSATFRTPDEAVQLANNTRYGLAASLWTENISLALDIAPRLAAGVVWVNATNLFDAAAGFGGYRESGFGREGGREGVYEYLRLDAWRNDAPLGVNEAVPAKDARAVPVAASSLRQRIVSTAAREPAAGALPVSPPALLASYGLGPDESESDTPAAPGIDRTAKLYIGGKQVRPDGGYSLPVQDAAGRYAGDVAEGNRKDIRNAVAAARKAQPSWCKATAHARAQILYFLAENLSVRAAEFARRLAVLTGVPAGEALGEVEQAVSRLFTYAAWADKFDGAVHAPPLRGVVLAMHEPLGVVGVGCPDGQSLLSLVSLLAPVVAMGNSAVLACGPAAGLVASDFYQVVETSDVPAGVLNIVTGDRDALTCLLAAHDDVDAVWSFGSGDAARRVEALSAGNLKRTFSPGIGRIDWSCREQAEGPLFLHKATQVKNIWIPYGD
jgi:aldehyde dehydrogenase (NAD+)